MALLSVSQSPLLSSPPQLSESTPLERGQIWVLDSEGEVVQALAWTQNGWRELAFHEQTESLAALASAPQKWAETSSLPNGQYLVRFRASEEN